MRAGGGAACWIRLAASVHAFSTAAASAGVSGAGRGREKTQICQVRKETMTIRNMRTDRIMRSNLMGLPPVSRWVPVQVLYLCRTIWNK